MAQGFGSNGPATVVVSNVEYRELAPSVDVPGTVVSRYDSSLASELSAKLVWIAEVGTVVKEGETVARMEDVTFRLLDLDSDLQIGYLHKEREKNPALGQIGVDGSQGLGLGRLHSVARYRLDGQVGGQVLLHLLHREVPRLDQDRAQPAAEDHHDVGQQGHDSTD